MTLLVVAPALSVDNFGAGVSIGVSSDRVLRALTVGTFGGFAFAATLVGAAMGRDLAHFVGGGGRVLGGGVLIALGARAVLKSDDASAAGPAVNSAGGVLAVAATVSTDTLVAGFGLGAGTIPVLVTASTILVVTCVATIVALQIGMRLGSLNPRRVARTAGALLVVAGSALLLGI